VVLPLQVCLPNLTERIKHKFFKSNQLLSIDESQLCRHSGLLRHRKMHRGWVLVVHTCNPSCSGGKEERIMVQSQCGQIVRQTLSQKNSSHTHKRRSGGVAQGVGPKFKLQYCKQTNKKKERCTRAGSCFQRASFSDVLTVQTS
jgi:hypothetical protein